MKDVFFDLNQSPNEWHRVELDKIFEIYGGFAAPKDDEAFKDGVIPFVRMQDLGRYHKTTNLVVTKDRLNANYVRQHKLRIVPKGSILIPRSGSVSLNHRAILGIDACIVSHICALVPKVSEVDVRFLYFSLCNFDMRTIMKKTTGLDAITFQDVKRIMIPLPSLSTQTTVADILQKADALKQKRQDANLIANKILQAVFLQMFGDPSKNPKQWKMESLGDFAVRITKGESPKWQNFEYVSDGALFIRSENVRWGYLDLSSETRIPTDFHKKLKRSQLQAGDVLINLVGASIGRAAVVPKGLGNANINQAVAVITPNSQLIADYLANLLISPSVQNIIQGGKVEAARANISLGDLRSLLIPIPPFELQLEFSELVHTTEMIVKMQDDSLQQINRLFPALIEKAFKGELVQ